MNLKDHCRSMELYGRKEALIRCIEIMDYSTGVKLCRGAMKEAHQRAKFNCAPLGPAAHRANFERIEGLRRIFRDLEKQKQIRSSTSGYGNRRFDQDYSSRYRNLN